MPGRLGPRFALEALFLIALAVGAGFADLATRWILLVMLAGWLVVALLELTTERLWAVVPPWRRPGYMAATQAPPVAAPPQQEPVGEPEPGSALEPEPVTVIVSRLEAEAVVLPGPRPEGELVQEDEPEPALLSRLEVEAAVLPQARSDPEPELESEPKLIQEPESDREPQPAAIEIERAAAEGPPEQPRRPTPEPLQPRPTRRWFRRRAEGPPEPAEPEPPAPQPVEPQPAVVEIEPAAAGRPPEQPGRPTLEPLQPRTTRRWFRRRAEEPPEPAPPEPPPKHVRLLPSAARPDRVSDEVAEIFDVSDREHRG
jgi:hypothetical protein